MDIQEIIRVLTAMGYQVQAPEGRGAGDRYVVQDPADNRAAMGETEFLMFAQAVIFSRYQLDTSGQPIMDRGGRPATKDYYSPEGVLHTISTYNPETGATTWKPAAAPGAERGWYEATLGRGLKWAPVTTEAGEQKWVLVPDVPAAAAEAAPQYWSTQAEVQGIINSLEEPLRSRLTPIPIAPGAWGAGEKPTEPAEPMPQYFATAEAVRAALAELGPEIAAQYQPVLMAPGQWRATYVGATEAPLEPRYWTDEVGGQWMEVGGQVTRVAAPPAPPTPPFTPSFQTTGGREFAQLSPDQWHYLAPQYGPTLQQQMGAALEAGDMAKYRALWQQATQLTPYQEQTFGLAQTELAQRQREALATQEAQRAQLQLQAGQFGLQAQQQALDIARQPGDWWTYLSRVRGQSGATTPYPRAGGAVLEDLQRFIPQTLTQYPQITQQPSFSNPTMGPAAKAV